VKKNNTTIVAVSGYFDPLHVGHLEYFVKAKELGDLLYVIVNSDFQAKLKKNTSFMIENDRLEIIQSLRIVDKAFLSIDKDKSVSNTLKMINPDIFGNGGDQIKGSILEERTCSENNIKIVDCLGQKIRSSSEITGIKSN
jgi:D-beta-D-heptose 7-phosphate kinase/D-beta-D-heptose 1-phosphate adenosyltransferase